MDKKVLFVGYEQGSELTEGLIKSYLKKGYIPMFAVSLQGTIRVKTYEQLLYANRVLVEMCDIIYVNCGPLVSPGFITDIIGYAKLHDKEIIINKWDKQEN